jgi:uncharacterized membrane protein (UPF0127 family)
MIEYIPQRASNLIIFLSYLLVFGACNASTSDHLKSYKTQSFKLPSGEEFSVYIAETYEQQKRGLSGIKPEDFPLNKGMLFPETEMRARQFWMPETHFDLDLFFMSANYYILDIHRGLKHYPKKGDRSEVPLSKEVFSQHVLELKANSPLAKKLKHGMLLKLKK